MKKVSRFVLGALAIALMAALAASPLAAQYGQGQQPPPPPPQQPGQAATPPAPPPVNKEEEDAYKAFYDLKNGDPLALIASGEELLKKFPETRYRESVYSGLAQAYLRAGQVDKLTVAGEKALAINPDNVDVLSLLSYSMLRRFDPNALDAEQKLAKAEGYAKHGIELLNAMQKPAQLTEELFTKAKNDKIAMCRSGLGLAYLHRQRYADAATELEQATKLTETPDATDLWLLGAVYQSSSRFKEAADAYGRCGELEWAWQDRCKQNAERAKQLAAKAAAAAPPAAPKP